jgi:hypothetical protein
MHCDDKGKKRMKKAVGSVAQKAAEGADSLLAEARQDVADVKKPEPVVSKKTEEMAEAVAKVKSNPEIEPKEDSGILGETTELVNSLQFSGGNKKMDKQFILESIKESPDKSLLKSKEAVGEFIIDLHQTQMEQEKKPLLNEDDFMKVLSFAEPEAFGPEDQMREGKAFGGNVLQSLDKVGKMFFSKAGEEEKSILGMMQKITGSHQDKEATISNLEGPDPIEASNNMPSIGYAEGGDVEGYAEGGELDMPEDTYDNIAPEDMEEVLESQLPDNEMENEYTEYVLGESLSDDEQDYLLERLAEDDRLGGIFDKLMDTAGEFAGEGAVEGPGDGTSDSIPARLSDGEFVFTKKSVEVIGADKLQEMMDDAERDYDEDREEKYEGGMMDSLMGEQDYDEEVHNQMLSANAMPSVRKR